MGCYRTQLRLFATLAAYSSAERASAIVGDMIRDQWLKADALHAELLTLALQCGFEPAGRHRHLSTVEWSTQRAATIARMLPNNLKEAEQ